MAEFVQHRLEEGLPELMEMQKAGIFSGKEIKVIVKKRKVFEYRMERRAKNKEDFLKYIQYEMSLLKLLRLRRKRMGISVDYKVDYAITNRINILFRKAIIRHQSDVKLWLSNIEFCSQVRWMEAASRLYASMLRVHSDKPEIWVAAAKFEFKATDSAATARNLFLRGLRFHPESKLLYLEYFRMELLNAQLKRKILKLGINTSNKEKPVTSFEEECINDPVLSGAVAMTVYRNATKSILEGSFAVSLLCASKDFDFAHQLRDDIYDDLSARFSNDEHTRAAITKRPIDELADTKLFQKDCSTKSIEVQCFNGFEKAVTDVPTEKMWTLYIQFCLERLECEDTDEAQERKRLHLVDVFSRAADKQLLSVDYYLKWVHLSDSDKRDGILKSATKTFPQNVKFWHERISRVLGRGESGPKRVSQLFDSALKAVPASESYAICVLSLRWHMLRLPSKVIGIFEKWLKTDTTSITSKVKTMYLEWVFTTNDMKAARKLYRRLWSMPPITLDFFFAAVDMELCTLKPSIERIRDIMESACRNYGTTSVDLWLRYTNLENKYSDDIGRVGHIHWRAVKALKPDLVDQFVAHRTLSQNNVTQ